MRRHSLGPDNIRKQLKSIFTSPSRSFSSSASQNFPKENRFKRRFSAPEKKINDDRSQTSVELHSIPEVSSSLFSILIEMKMKTRKEDRRFSAAAFIFSFDSEKNEAAARRTTKERRFLDFIKINVCARRNREN